MPSLLKYTQCPQCGHRHHFCLASGQVEQDREYSYVCPEKGTRGSLRAPAAGEDARWAPQGAVELTPHAARGNDRWQSSALRGKGSRGGPLG
jgi:hypothetical protein